VIKPRVVAVIPAFNEALAITAVVQGALKYCSEVVVVDDHSADDTCRAAILSGATCIRHETNLGQGAATRTGIAEALKLGADIVVTLDGDGQHNPDEIPKLLAALDGDGTGAVIGSRFLKGAGKIPAYRKFGIRMINAAFNFGSRQVVSDSLLCLRAFTKETLRGLKIEDDGFGFCPEMLTKLRHNKVKMKEIPVSCIYYADYKQNSTLSPVHLGLIVGWKILVWRLRVEVLHWS